MMNNLLEICLITYTSVFSSREEDYGNPGGFLQPDKLNKAMKNISHEAIVASVFKQMILSREPK